MTTKTEELKPCPFCGEAAYFERHGTHRQSCIVACQSCGCSLETGETGDDCGGMWNGRVAQPAASAGPATKIGRVDVVDGRVQGYGFEQTDIPTGSYYLHIAPVAARPSVPDNLIQRLRKHCEDKGNSAFARSTMREALGYLSPTPPAGEQAQQDAEKVDAITDKFILGVFGLDGGGLPNEKEQNVIHAVRHILKRAQPASGEDALLRVELAAAQANVTPLSVLAERWLALRDVPDDLLGHAGIPCISIPDGPKRGKHVNGEDADQAVVQFIAARTQQEGK